MVMPLSSSTSIVAPNPVKDSTEAQTALIINSDFTFTEDMNTPIIVAADHVVIDGNGFTLQGPDAGNDPNVFLVGIDISMKSKVTVKNLLIQGWDVGIGMYRGSKCKILDNTIMFCHIGLVDSGGVKNMISGNTANSNGYVGFQILSSYKNQLLKNLANDNGWGGFFLGSSSENRIVENTAIGNNVGQAHPAWGNGFMVFYSSSGNYFTHNFASSNGRGFWLNTGTSDNDLVENIATDEWDGINLFESRNNYLSGNTITSCENGILAAGAVENWLEANVISWPLGGPYYPPGEDYIYPNFGIAITEGGDNTAIRNSVSNLPVGFWLDWTENNYLVENTATNCYQEGFRVLASDFNTLEHNMATYTIELPEFWMPSGFYVFEVLPGVIESSGNNVFLENTATNVVFGYRMGEGTYETELIRNEALYNRRGFEGGGTGMHYIENIASYNSECGFSIRASDSYFIGNTITHNGFAIYGHGIWMIDSDRNVFQNNYIFDSYRGFEFAGDSNDNRVYNNTIEGSYASLIIIDTSMSNYVYHNNFISETNLVWYGPGPLIDYNYLYNPDSLEGNYWSDYDGTTIPWHFDPYPFMTMNGWL